MLAYLNPVQGIYTGICVNGKDSPPLFGQIRYAMGSRCAHLAFILPVDDMNSISLPNLLEHLTYQAGGWGAMHIIAEVDGQTAAFEGLRRAGFSTFAWQRIWKFRGSSNTIQSAEKTSDDWQLATENDGLAVRLLYQSLVPAMVQPMESLVEKRLQGMICRRKGELVAYAELTYGPRGICVQPYVHPDAECIADLLTRLVNSIPVQAGRPIYLIARSYQGWLESTLEELNVEVGPRQALMARHLAISTRVAQPLRIPGLENGRAEPSAPIIQVDQH